MPSMPFEMFLRASVRLLLKKTGENIKTKVKRIMVIN